MLLKQNNTDPGIKGNMKQNNMYIRQKLTQIQTDTNSVNKLSQIQTSRTLPPMQADTDSATPLKQTETDLGVIGNMDHYKKNIRQKLTPIQTDTDSVNKLSQMKNSRTLPQMQADTNSSTPNRITKLLPKKLFKVTNSYEKINQDNKIQ